MTSPAAASGTPRTALVIHGGAGVIERNTLSGEDEREIRRDLDRALDAGGAVLTAGGVALDAVEAAIAVLEDALRFNAGRGAVFSADGRHELDAAIMAGHTRRAGSVAGVTTVRHPIRLARAVMEHSAHVMLAGAGAERFADTRKEIERVANAWFDTDIRREQLHRAQEAERRDADPVIPVQAGHASATTLMELGFDVTWRTYAMPHAVCPEEIRDLGDWFDRVFSGGRPAG